MSELNILDFDSWDLYEGFIEGSGCSEKVWLHSPTGEIGLFKYPKTNSEGNEVTSEHISEHLAYILAKALGIHTAVIDIGIRDGKIGCMSYLLNKPDEAIVEGALVIAGKHPDYDIETMRETISGQYYNIKHIFEVFDTEETQRECIKMMLFDFIIGNSDRHQNNWAVLVKLSETGELKGRFCPLYDNGSSLCSYISDEQALTYLGNDRRRFEALVDTKSRSMIRFDGGNKKHPLHSEMVKYLLENYFETRNIIDDILMKADKIELDQMVGVYDKLLSSDKRKLIIKFISRKFEILKELRCEVTK